MSEKHTKTISVEGTEITILQIDDTDYICITDMLKAKDGDFFISDWLRNRITKIKKSRAINRPFRALHG